MLSFLMSWYVYWQGIDRDIEDRVKLCNTCQLASKMLLGINCHHGRNSAWERIHISKMLEMDSQRKKYLSLGGVMGDMRTELAMLM